FGALTVGSRRPSRRGVYGGGSPGAAGNRQDLVWPVLVVVVDDMARSERSDPLVTVRACGREYLCTLERPERDQQTAGHAAGAVHQEPIAGLDIHCFVQNLLGGQGGHQKRGRTLPGDTRRLRGKKRS